MIGRIVVSLDALRKNAATLRDLVGAGRAAFVVKSNAYGHGLVETALAVEPFATRLCVYSVDEGLALRDGGITGKILVLGPVPPASLGDALAHELEIALWDVKHFARDVARAARRRHRIARVHVKLNTGLNRLGLEPHELGDALEEYVQFSEFGVAGIFSHLASAEELDSPYTMQQLDTFVHALAGVQSLLETRGIAPIRHIAASAAAMLWPQTRLDMARFGIALYGLWPSPQTREAMGDAAPLLEPALSYESEVAVTRTIPAGAPVGYGATYHAPRDMRIGVVPVGYADGVPRALSNRGAFLVDGAACPVVGRVAMNMTSIDLTGAPQAHVGSRVVLLGDEGTASVSADAWAGWCETINYEIVARLPAHIERSYAG